MAGAFDFGRAPMVIEWVTSRGICLAQSWGKNRRVHPAPACRRATPSSRPYFGGVDGGRSMTLGESKSSRPMRRNISARTLRRWLPPRGLCSRDITSRTRTSATPAADGTAPVEKNRLALLCVWSRAAPATKPGSGAFRKDQQGGGVSILRKQGRRTTLSWPLSRTERGGAIS